MYDFAALRVYSWVFVFVGSSISCDAVLAIRALWIPGATVDDTALVRYITQSLTRSLCPSLIWPEYPHNIDATSCGTRAPSAGDLYSAPGVNAKSYRDAAFERYFPRLLQQRPKYKRDLVPDRRPTTQGFWAASYQNSPLRILERCASCQLCFPAIAVASAGFLNLLPCKPSRSIMT